MKDGNIRRGFHAGIDIGSTTVKLAIIDEDGNTVFGKYRRHLANTKQTLIALLGEAHEALGDLAVSACITGSGAIGIAKSLGIKFVQEVVAVATALKKYHPLTDVAVELGGEDAKIIYFAGGLDERMNGVCAGGTGSFIDQMASLLQTDASGLNTLAEGAHEIYPIASRCGVFAKTDIQPLINDGAAREDIAASVLQAVVNQTVSGLACGKPIRGKVAFLGGPLHFLPELKKLFIKTLGLGKSDVIDPENSHLFAAMGAAMTSQAEQTDGANEIALSALSKALEDKGVSEFETKRLDVLFKDEDEYNAFASRHAKATVKKGDVKSYVGKCFLGIDAGSTTTKLALIGEDGELLYSSYENNKGDPVKTALDSMKKLRDTLPESAHIARACSTGYGELLLKSAFSLDEGEVETVAHATAAKFFDPETDCVLDIGGQDMKCIRLKNGAIDSIMLNEACSSGCGSFIENFANSLSMSAEEFAKEAIFAKAPVDLGTRCTVFMNSNVKQAQKEGADVSDISAGLAYSVIKNALYKVIKLSSADDLGKHIVVQGGTFYNRAVLRALEAITETNVICPDISGLMGAFGAALLAREHYDGKESSIIPLDTLDGFSYKSRTTRCGGCENNCMLTVNTFSTNKKYITGNRCEKMVGSNGTGARGEDLVEYKRQRIFGYEPLTAENAPRGVIGIPRVLNIYENYPFWATFFKELGFSVVLSPYSSRKIYQLGMDSIPSESECYPAKLAHGHVKWLIDNGVKTIFHPSVFYERTENSDTKNHYNCPMVISYPENIKNNMEEVAEGGVRYLHPFLAFTDEKTITKRLCDICADVWSIDRSEVKKAVSLAWAEQTLAKEDIRKEGARLLQKLEREGGCGIVLAGRPYHIDPEINHGIPEMIASFGLSVFTEDSLPLPKANGRQLRVLDQWTYHARLYAAAEYVCTRQDLELIQLNSFGCGLDAVTTDQVCEILENAGRLYTVLKIDEVNNLGSARIRVRSLIAAMKMKKESSCGGECKQSENEKYDYKRVEFTKEMFDAGYTILAPSMSPIHFDILKPVFTKNGFNIVMLDKPSKRAVDMGLKYVNNDACYPSIITVGQMMDAVLSGEYDTSRLALLMTQTGGCCRASNYVGFIRRALEGAGISHIPVISLSAQGLEKNSGFKLKLPMLADAMKGLIWGDVIMRCLYRTRPYEIEVGSANAMRDKWIGICSNALSGNGEKLSYKQVCRDIVADFDALPIYEDMRKPRVGIVGEILVKYMPIANNNLVELLEKEGAEAVVPDLLDFLSMCIYNMIPKEKELGAPFKNLIVSHIGIDALKALRAPAADALKKSKRFSPPIDIEKTAEYAEKYLSTCNQYGEGWFLCGEMIELIHDDTPNIVCVQPFGCLPNHVVGKGVIKAIKKDWPYSNIAAVDYDPGASEVNQLNRIKLMLATAKDNMEKAQSERRREGEGDKTSLSAALEADA